MTDRKEFWGYSQERFDYFTGLLIKDEFLGPRGKINFAEYISLEPESAKELLQNRLQHLISGLTILDSDSPYGVYNRHDFAHIEAVHEKTHRLLNIAELKNGKKFSNQARNVATAICYLHDIGNNLQRKGHGEISARLFSKLFTKCSESDPLIKSILLGIRVHDEEFSVGYEDLADLPKLHPELDIELIQVIWAVVAADKFDVGRHRLSTTLTGRLPEGEERTPEDYYEIIEKTPHTGLVLYAAKNEFSFSPDGEMGVWTIQFSSEIESEEEEIIKEILKKFEWIKEDGRKTGDLYVPQEWHRPAWKEKNLSYSDSYIANLEQLYCTRLAIMLSCLYALFPQLDLFEIKVVDRRNFIGRTSTTEFRKSNWKHALFVIWKNFQGKAYKDGDVEVPTILKRGKQLFQASEQA